MAGINWDLLREMAATMRAYMEHVEASHCLDVRDAKHLPPQTKLVVTCSQEATVEFTILDNASGKALVKDGKNPEPPEGRLLGTTVSEKVGNPPGTWKPGPRVLLPGQLKRMGLLTYEVGGKQRYADGIRAVEIILPTGTRFRLWYD